MATIKIMCVNAGSSSLKFKLYEMGEGLNGEKTLREKAKHMKVLTSRLSQMSSRIFCI